MEYIPNKDLFIVNIPDVIDNINQEALIRNEITEHLWYELRWPTCDDIPKRFPPTDDAGNNTSENMDVSYIESM